MVYSKKQQGEGGIGGSRKGILNKSTIKKSDIIDALNEIVHDEDFIQKFKDTLMTLEGKQFLDAFVKYLEFIRVKKQEHSFSEETLEALGVIEYPAK
ncbi:unnamed protein product, partial [marine sediment metagenome]